MDSLRVIRSLNEYHGSRDKLPAALSPAFLSLISALLLSALAGGLRAQDTLIWNSAANAVNRTSTGALMDGCFRFQLGVFQGTFVPTAGNIGQWAANWVAARHTPYIESTARYADSFSIVSNAPPFTAGKAAYVWGFKGDAASGEWILFRATSWTWPAVNIGPPNSITWRARDATPVIGEINFSLSPFQMKSVAVANVAPPVTSWDQWVSTDLAGEVLNGPCDDPDQDGTPNLLEFIFGTDPRLMNAPTSTPVHLVDGHLVITIPRRVDRPAVLLVEVSSDLVIWNSGPAYTEELQNDLSALVVKDLTSNDSSHPTRFMRLRASLP